MEVALAALGSLSKNETVAIQGEGKSAASKVNISNQY
jgi:hypothetical protein